jgi:hypothetical protein
VWTLSLLPAVLAHLVVDLISGLSGAKALRNAQSERSGAERF